MDHKNQLLFLMPKEEEFYFIEKEIESTSILLPEEQALVDLLAGIMVDAYFATIEKDTVIKNE